MSKWTSKRAILRDLSEAQGLVPVEIEGIVSAEDKPPPLTLTEETEEEFYRHYGEGDVNMAPDCDLIKKMLNIISDINLNNDDNENTSESPETSEMSTETQTELPTNKHKNKRKERNAAFESIFKMENNNETTPEQNKHETIKINNINQLIGHDITPQNGISKITNIKTSSPPKKSPQLSIEPISMFRKKSPTQKLVQNTDNKVTKQVSYCNGTYKPSEMADEYYKKYMEKLKLNETIREDIWSRAEKQMKEIEAKKKLEQAATSSTSSDSEQINGNKSLDVVRLPQHRHMLQDNCVLCEIIQKHGYNIH